MYELEFHRIQTFYVIPSIKELSGEMKGKFWNLFQKELLVLCGNGQMAPPWLQCQILLVHHDGLLP